MAEECRYVEVEALVERGLGEGAYYVSIYSPSFERALGFKPYPGTLNARVYGASSSLRDCLDSGGHVLVEPPVGSRGLKPVLVYRAELVGEPRARVYLVKPLASKHGDDVIELISNTYLREALGLRDGDVVRVRVYCEWC